jgi:hypothetical protein
MTAPTNYPLSTASPSPICGWGRATRIRDEGFEFDHQELVPTEDGGVEYRPIPEERQQRPNEVVLQALPDIRNGVAHGQPI